MVNDFECQLQYAKENTALPKTPDMKLVEEFVEHINTEAINA